MEVGPETGNVTENPSSALGDVIDLGVYPNCFANDTTLSLSVAESRNSSLTTILALNAV
jgi:hypothetical protein